MNSMRNLLAKSVFFFKNYRPIASPTSTLDVIDI